MKDWGIVLVYVSNVFGKDRLARGIKLVRGAPFLFQINLGRIAGKHVSLLKKSAGRRFYLR